MSNIAGKAYAMNVVTPSKPYLTWINRLIFMVSRGLPSTLGGLLGLSLIHYARWVIIRRDQWPDLGQGKQTLQNDYMLFCSNFNGTWDQYIDAFSDGIPNGLNLFWYTATKYPQSIPVTVFKNNITYNQIPTDYYYNATPGAAQRDVKCALKVHRAIEALAEAHGRQTPGDFAATFRARLIEDYTSVRSAVSEITTTLLVLTLGAILFGAATPGLVSLAAKVSDVIAHGRAVADFPLGRWAGGYWYAVFPPQIPLWTVIGIGVALAMVASLVTTFAGILADPVQAALGIHRRRLMRLLASLDAAEDARPGLAGEHLLARMGDLADAATSLARLFRP